MVLTSSQVHDGHSTNIKHTITPVQQQGTNDNTVAIIGPKLSLKGHYSNGKQINCKELGEQLPLQHKLKETTRRINMIYI